LQAFAVSTFESMMIGNGMLECLVWSCMQNMYMITSESNYLHSKAKREGIFKRKPGITFGCNCDHTLFKRNHCTSVGRKGVGGGGGTASTVATWNRAFSQ